MKNVEKWIFIKKKTKQGGFYCTPPHIILFTRMMIFFLSHFLFQFQFHHSILDLLEIKFHNIFQFIFYEVILYSWTGPRVLLINSVNSIYFLLFLIEGFFPSISYCNIRLIENKVSWFVSVFFTLDYPHLMTGVTSLAS